MAAQNVLVIQHIWTRWSRKSCGANSALRRIRPDAAYPLPNPLPDGRAICHDVRCFEADQFELITNCGAIDSLDQRSRFAGLNRLSWHQDQQVMRFRFQHHASRDITSNQPAASPVNLVVKPGKSLRIDWNARLPMSLSGGNRSSIYEQHIFSIYFGDRGCIPDFLALKHNKVVDLTNAIY